MTEPEPTDPRYEMRYMAWVVMKLKEGGISSADLDIVGRAMFETRGNNENR